MEELADAEWRAFDKVLCLINSLDVQREQTADQMRRRIYGLVHDLRPTRQSPEAVTDETTNLLDDLQQAEFEYRLMHDRHGDGSQAAGRAWDLMRRAGDKARAALLKVSPRP